MLSQLELYSIKRRNGDKIVLALPYVIALSLVVAHRAPMKYKKN